MPAGHHVRWASPIYWAVGDNQLSHGWSWPGAAVTVGLCGALVAATLPALCRLDIP